MSSASRKLLKKLATTLKLQFSASLDYFA